MKSNKKPKLFLTGAGGFLGQGIAKSLENDYDLHLCDIKDFESNHKKFIGDVSDPQFCNSSLKGMDYLVIAHMFPRPNDKPFGPYNANVTGTANLCYAAKLCGIKKICLISSVDVLKFNRNLKKGELPHGGDIYSSTKVCQEIVAQSMSIEFELDIKALRIGYVVDFNSLQNKYGRSVSSPSNGMIDRYDCGEAIAKTLQLNYNTYETFHIYSIADPIIAPEAVEAWEKLNWHPQEKLLTVSH